MMYPFKYTDFWILGATWIFGVGIVVVQNSNNEVKAYMKPIPDSQCYNVYDSEEMQDATYVALYGSSISLKAAKELGVYWNEIKM